MRPASTERGRDTRARTQRPDDTRDENPRGRQEPKNSYHPAGKRRGIFNQTHRMKLLHSTFTLLRVAYWAEMTHEAVREALRTKHELKYGRAWWLAMAKRNARSMNVCASLYRGEVAA